MATLARIPNGIRGRTRSLVVPLLCVLLAQATPGAAADHTTYVVGLPGADRTAMARVEALGGVIDHFDGETVRAYIHVAHWPEFLASGIAHSVLEVQPRAGKQLDSYPSYDALTAILNEAASNYPDIVRLESMGRSVQGRELWAIRITDFPDLEEDEPEFVYFSTLHGDEKIGTILCLNFLEHLLEGYGSDGFITDLIDDTDIWLAPLMNPDGYEMNLRWNANNQDLNRSFPEYSRDFFGTLYSEGVMSTAGRQPEVARIMDWASAHSFVFGANYHSGALVINYPYDEEPGIPSGTNAPSPDDALMLDLSLTYADRNPPMAASPVFANGVTNGSAWYSISGGLQDWHYRYGGAVHITFEVSNVKTPNTNALAGLWEDNREAMLAYLSLVHRSVRGVVTDLETGAPLYARVRVNDNPQPVFTDPDVGDYHRMALPGAYTVRVDSAGYIPYTVAGVNVGGSGSTRVDVALSQGDVNGDGSVNAADLQLVINAVLEIQELPEADVDGNGVSATDVQHLVNRVLNR